MFTVFVLLANLRKLIFPIFVVLAKIQTPSKQFGTGIHIISESGLDCCICGGNSLRCANSIDHCGAVLKAFRFISNHNLTCEKNHDC